MTSTTNSHGTPEEEGIGRERREREEEMVSELKTAAARSQEQGRRGSRRAADGERWRRIETSESEASRAARRGVGN